MEFQPWEKEMTAVTVIYRMVECHEKIPVLALNTKWATVEPVLQDMFNKDLIEPSQDNQHWVLAKKGRDLLTRIVGMIDTSLRFEIFASYNFEAEVAPEHYKPNTTEVLDDIWDPRFDPESEGHKEDLRLAMMTWMAEKLKRGEKGQGDLDPRRIVYLRQLAHGDFKDDGKFFFLEPNLRRVFDEVNKIVDSAYGWKDLGDSVEESFELGQILYTAGMLQLKKEEGPSCGECDAPLACFKNPKECPVCGADFYPPVPEEGEECECPNCGTDARVGQKRCLGCGASFHFDLPEGTVIEEEETVTTTEYTSYYDGGYGYCYGYQPYGWYNPYDPYVDALAFGVICGAILF